MSNETLPQPYQWTFRRVIWATLLIVFVGLSFWVIYRSSQAIFILFIAILFGTVIRPAVNWLYSRGISRTAGAIFIYLLLFVLLIVFLLLLFPLIADQSEKIFILVPIYYQRIREWFMGASDPLISQLGRLLPVYLSIPMLARETGQDVLNSAAREFSDVTFIAKVIITAMVTPLLAFYWTLYGPRAIQSLLLIFSTNQRERVRELIAAMESKISSYVVGQSILCLVIGILALIAYVIIGLPNALTLAIVAGLLEAIPVIGPFLGAVPAAIIALTLGPTQLLWVIVATVVIQQIENSFLVPRVMKKTVGVNPFVTLLALFAFSSLLGIPGALMAIPIAAMLQLLLDYFVFEPNSAEADISTGRDYASRLRYEAQDLMQDLRKHVRLKRGGSDSKVKQIDQVLDEIEAITTDLDALLAQVSTKGEA
jgi:predicted PurR-regulated permease PerM